MPGFASFLSRLVSKPLWTPLGVYPALPDAPVAARVPARHRSVRTALHRRSLTHLHA